MPSRTAWHRSSIRAALLTGVVATAIVLLYCQSPDQVPEVRPIPSAGSGPPRIYRSNFSVAEDPISDGGRWISAKAAALDWSDIRTVPGLAYGSESGTSKFDDSTALLAGNWGPNQMVEARVHTLNQNDRVYEEVELRLRSSLALHRATGYEISFRCSKSPVAYSEIVRWNGKWGSFTYLRHVQGPQYGVTDGDVVKAVIIGNLIKAYINDIEVVRATDNTYRSGSPGMGFYLFGRTGLNPDYGFTELTATDGPFG